VYSNGRFRGGSLNDRLWPTAGVRERQQFGGPTRTTGFGQGNRERQDPESTRCCRSSRRNA